ncbi:MAG: hypothetical protein QW528_03930, partial [Candidatus Micrarchaeaceae archaeon]
NNSAYTQQYINTRKCANILMIFKEFVSKKEIRGGWAEVTDIAFPMKQSTLDTCGIACIGAIPHGEEVAPALSKWFQEVLQNTDRLLTVGHGTRGMEIITLAREIDEVYNKKLLLFKSIRYKIDVYTTKELLANVYDGENKRDGSVLDKAMLERDIADLESRKITMHYSVPSFSEIIKLVSNGNYVIFDKGGHWMVAFGVLHVSYSDESKEDILMTMDPLIGVTLNKDNSIEYLKTAVMSWANISGKSDMDANGQAVVVNPGVHGMRKLLFSPSTLKAALRS